MQLTGGHDRWKSGGMTRTEHWGNDQTRGLGKLTQSALSSVQGCEYGVQHVIDISHIVEVASADYFIDRRALHPFQQHAPELSSASDPYI